MLLKIRVYLNGWCSITCIQKREKLVETSCPSQNFCLAVGRIRNAFGLATDLWELKWQCQILVSKRKWDSLLEDLPFDLVQWAPCPCPQTIYCVMHSSAIVLRLSYSLIQQGMFIRVVWRQSSFDITVKCLVPTKAIVVIQTSLALQFDSAVALTQGRQVSIIQRPMQQCLR